MYIFFNLFNPMAAWKKLTALNLFSHSKQKKVTCLSIKSYFLLSVFTLLFFCIIFEKMLSSKYIIQAICIFMYKGHKNCKFPNLLESF